MKSTPRLVLCELEDPGIPGLESLSPFCLKVHRALQLSGLPYDRRPFGRPDAVRRYNPAGQVPVLLVGDEPVADSTRILTRLEALSSGALSRGLDDRGRAEALLWEEMADTVLANFVVAARWLDPDNWPRTRAKYFARMPALVRAVVPDRIRRRIAASLTHDLVRPDLAACWARFDVMLDALEDRAPAHGFWLGREVSRADVALFAPLASFGTELTPRQRDAVAIRTHLSAWLGRVNAACTGVVERTTPSSDRLRAPATPVLAAASSFG